MLQCVDAAFHSHQKKNKSHTTTDEMQKP